MADRKAPGKRRYRMRARAEAAAATGERILEAAQSVFSERSPNDVTLAAVAERAGVTVQTVLRHYKDRQGLTEAALERLAAQLGRQRRVPAAGDVGDAVSALIDHYETIGDVTLRMLAEESRNPMLHAVTDLARRHHRGWCADAFAPALEGLEGVERERRVAQLVAATDIHVWKVIQRERGLSRRQTELALCELLEPLMGRRP